MIIGFPEAVDTVVEILREYLRNSFIDPPKPLYAVYKGLVEKKISPNECLATTPLGKNGLLRDPLCTPSQETYLTIIGYKDDLETPILRRGVSVVGRYMVLDDSGRVVFSEHIRDEDTVTELRGFSELVTREGFGVKWRSSSKYINTVSILDEYSFLKNLYREILEKLKTSEQNKFVYIGEKICFAHLSTEDMIILDAIRSSVHATSVYHHAMRAYTNLREIIDLIDLFSEKISKKESLEKYLRFVIDRSRENNEILILHRKLFYSKPIFIGPAKILFSEISDNLDEASARLILYRNVRSEGVYDGIDAPKEFGDKILSFIDTAHRFIFHAYYRADNSIKGVYVNSNTRPILLYDIDYRVNRSRVYLVYNDLALDAAIKENESKLLDEEEFNTYCSNGWIRSSLCEYLLREFRKILDRASEIYSILKELPSRVSIESISEDEARNILAILFKDLDRGVDL